MAKIRMIVIEGEMETDEVVRLAKAFGAGDEAFTSIQLPNGVTGQAATLSRGESQPRPRPVATPAPTPEKEEAPAPAAVIEAAPVPAPAPVAIAPEPLPAELPPAVAKVFPEVVVESAAATLVEDLLGCKRLVGVLERLQQEGHKELPALIDACKALRDQVPMLQRLGDGLEDRVTRTFEGMR